jgi:hypothetical protein
METTNNLNIVQRVQAPTPSFFKKLRTIGLVLAAVSASIVAVPLALPLLVTQVAGYLAVAGGIITTISQLTVEDTAKHQEELYE